VVEEPRDETVEICPAGPEESRECRRLQREIQLETAGVERLLELQAMTPSLSARAAIAEQIEAARYRAGVLRRRSALLCPAEN